MEKMKRMPTRKSHSWWRDSHISPNNSKWLAENLEEMDQRVKRMLKLIEEDGDSFAKKAEMYYQKRPELVSCVEDFYRMYRALAERYDQVTGELRRSIPSELQSQGSDGGSDFSSELASPSPDHKTSRRKAKHHAAGFDVFVHSGGSSELSHNATNGSSSLSSESDSDEVSTKEHLSSLDENGNAEHERILELENELADVKQKLQEFEGQKVMENGNFDELRTKISVLEEELIATNQKLSLSEEEIAKLRCELDQEVSLERKQDLQKLELARQETDSLEAEIELEKKEITALQKRIAVLENDVSDREHTIKEFKVEMTERFSQEKSRLELEVSVQLGLLEDELVVERKRVSELQDRILMLENDILDRNSTIQELETALADATERFSREKLQFKVECTGLAESRLALEAKLGECMSRLEEELKQTGAEKSEMQGEIERMKNENINGGKYLEQLNQDFDKLKLKYDTLVAERDELNAKLQSLIADIGSRDERIGQMDDHLHRLHMEHVKLIAGSESARKLTQELQARVKELEDETARQRVAISDHAEEKREVIRQLCFSLDHYRDGYYQLRQALQGHKRPAVMAS